MLAVIKGTQEATWSKGKTNKQINKTANNNNNVKHIENDNSKAITELAEEQHRWYSAHTQRF